MKTRTMWKLAAAVAVTVAGAAAQTATPLPTQFQQAGQMAPQGTWQIVRPATSVGITGKPMSATEERKTVQTLADGTQIETADTNVLYRDIQGRTRTEQPVQGNQRIVITDPVARVSYTLDPATKTARKTTAAVLMPAVARGGRGGAIVARSGGVGGVATPSTLAAPTTEELGVQTINGVAAQGTRVTQIIPAGKIGNNRDIHVVNERWYSTELQMVVKTVNSDPRFGVTTYQITNINQAVPDASLFQVPADYKVIEPDAVVSDGRK